MSASSPPDWVITLLIPTLGTVIGTVMWLSPLKAVLAARNSQSLGDLNPAPFLITVFNCIAWVIYSNLLHDMFIFWANAPGLTLGLYYSLSCMSVLASNQINCTKSRQYLAHCEYFLVFTVGFWCLMSMAANIILTDDPADRARASTFMGTLACATFLVYYAAPLSTMVRKL
jgi:solute carrier family 50 (sugar transporter)